MAVASSARLAWGLSALTAVLFGFALVTGLQVTPRFAPLAVQVQWWAIAILSLAFMTFSVVGALVASHTPRNTIGWLFLGIGGAAGLALASLVYTETSLPGPAWAEWVADWSGVTVFSQVAFVLLLFPNGKLPSPRWRVVAWVTGLAGLGQVIGSFTPHSPPDYNFSNPVGIEAIRGTILQDGNFGWVLLPVGWWRRPLPSSCASGARPGTAASS
jgi:two-component system, NarL family, sensor kinase